MLISFSLSLATERKKKRKRRKERYSESLNRRVWALSVYISVKLQLRFNVMFLSARNEDGGDCGALCCVHSFASPRLALPLPLECICKFNSGVCCCPFLSLSLSLSLYSLLMLLEETTSTRLISFLYIFYIFECFISGVFAVRPRRHNNKRLLSVV